MIESGIAAYLNTSGEEKIKRRYNKTLNLSFKLYYWKFPRKPTALAVGVCQEKFSVYAVFYMYKFFCFNCYSIACILAFLIAKFIV